MSAGRRATGTLAAACLIAILAACGGHANVKRPSAHHVVQPHLIVRPPPTPGLPPQGLYEECEPANQTQCAGELAQMGKAGFRLVLDYSSWYGSASKIESYASEAQADGLEVIWALDDSAWRDPASARTLLSTYPQLAPSCGCSTNGGFLKYSIHLVETFSATWGYYIGDELTPSEAPAVARLAAAVRKLDPGHPLLYVGLGASDLAKTLPPFEAIANVVGVDDYPIGNGGTAQAIQQAASNVRALSKAYHTRPALALQAFDWSQYPRAHSVHPRWPTEAEMQTMRNEALAASPAMILWYSIYDILRSGDPADHWRDLIDAAFAPGPAG